MQTQPLMQWWLIPQQAISTRLMRLISFSKILKARTTTVYLWLPIGKQVLWLKISLQQQMRFVHFHILTMLASRKSRICQIPIRQNQHSLHQLQNPKLQSHSQQHLQRQRFKRFQQAKNQSQHSGKKLPVFLLIRFKSQQTRSSQRIKRPSR